MNFRELSSSLYSSIFSTETVERLIYSALIVFVIFALRFLILFFVGKRVRQNLHRIRWRRSSMYIALFMIFLLVAPLWMSSIQGVLAVLSIFGAGVLLVLKEVILNIAGWFYINIRRPFLIGNRVIINGIIGDVFEVRLLDFSMIEVNSREDGGQSTGRIIHMPNSLLFLQPLSNASKEFSFNWNEIKIPLTMESDWKKARQIVLDVANQSIEAISESDARLRDSEEQYAIRFARLEPAVFVEFRKGVIVLSLRHLTEPRRTRMITDSIWSELLSRFKRSKTIQLAAFDS